MKADISVRDLMDKNRDYLIIDIRDQIAYQHGHIENAFSLTDASTQKVKELLNKEKKSKAAVYCSIGENSKDVVTKLRKEGISAWNLQGGFKEWLVLVSEIFDEKELKRYSRQMILPQIGQYGQEKLKKAKILVVGAGGLGCPALMYLAAAGAGTIGIADKDRVDITNLQRQIMHDMASVGEKKIISAKTKIEQMNPDTKVRLYDEFLTPENIEDIIEEYDFVIDGVDNFESKFLINDACVIHKKPFCHAGILRFEGQVMTWLPGKGACYRCIFEDVPDEYIPNCSQAGIVGAVAGIIGSIQALEAIKYIIGAGELLTGRMFILDGLTMNTRIVNFNRSSEKCRVCGVKPEITDIKANKDRYKPKNCSL